MSRKNIVQIALPEAELTQLKREAAKIPMPLASYVRLLVLQVMKGKGK